MTIRDTTETMGKNDNCDKEIMVMTVVKIMDVVTQKFKK